MVKSSRLLTKIASRMCKNMKQAPQTTWEVPVMRKTRFSTASSKGDDEEADGDPVES